MCINFARPVGGRCYWLFLTRIPSVLECPSPTQRPPHVLLRNCVSVALRLLSVLVTDNCDLFHDCVSRLNSSSPSWSPMVSDMYVDSTIIPRPLIRVKH